MPENPPGRPYREPDSSTYEGRVGANLRQLRLRKYARLDDFVGALAEHGLEVGKTAVSQWELGERLLKFRDIPVVCEVLGVTPNDLIVPLQGKRSWKPKTLR